MADRVFVHIGAPKSGTSYLQDRIERNRDALLERGLSYPVSKPDGHFEPALDLIQRSWAGQLEKVQGQWKHLADTVRGTRGDVLVSHEILAGARPERVQQAFDSFGDAEVHIVLTARDFGRQWPAEWQESVKHRKMMSFDNFARRVQDTPRMSSDLWFWRVQSVPDVLGRWSNRLLPEQVHVVTVPPPGAPQETLWERFLSVLGIEPSGEFAPAGVDNASLGIAEIMMLRRLNRKLRRGRVSRETYVPMVRELIAREVFSGRDRSPAPVLPPRFRAFAEEVCEEWVEWIEGAGVDVVGSLDDLVPQWPEETPNDIDHPTASDVADAAIDALAAVLGEWDDSLGRSRSPLDRLRWWNDS